MSTKVLLLLNSEPTRAQGGGKAQKIGFLDFSRAHTFLSERKKLLLTGYVKPFNFDNPNTKFGMLKSFIVSLEKNMV